MKSILTFAFAIISSLAFSQSVYYVSNLGNDKNSGRSPAESFLTIDKINKIKLQPGDRILFKKGNEFTGSIKIKNLNADKKTIEIGSYGLSKDRPIINGSRILLNWKRIKKNIWQAHCEDCPDTLTNIFMGGRSLPLGRFPNLTDNNNQGYLTIKSHKKKHLITSKTPLLANWEGGELVHRASQWIIDRTHISGQNGQDLVLIDKAEEIKDNWGFFIQNHLNTLDVSGEWYYDNKQNKVFIYYEGNPNKEKVSVSIAQYGIEITNAKNISVQNLTFRHQASAGIRISNSSNMHLNNIIIKNSGLDGIKLELTNNNIKISDSKIHDCFNNAVDAFDTHKFTFTNNEIRNIGLSPGRGRKGNGQYLGIKYMSKRGHAIISNNLFDSIGYIGIDFRASNITIEKNVIKNTNLVKGDGGAIYTWNRKNNYPYIQQKILSNIILYSKGNLNGTYMSSASAYGIYMDDCAQNVEIEGNTIAYCTNAGVFLHGTKNITLKKNISYGNGEQILISYSNCGEVRDNKILENIFFCTDPAQMTARYETRKDDLRLYGQFENNKYQHQTNNGIIVAQNLDIKHQKQYLTLSQWQKLINQDLKSSNFFTPNSEKSIKSRLIINDTKRSKAIQPKANTTYLSTIKNYAKLEPFQSLIMVENKLKD